MTPDNSSSSILRYKIILVGDSGVGKTSIFWRYIHNQFIVDQPITAVDFRYKIIKLHDKQIKLCVWDTAGQEKFRSIVATYFKSCQGVILVFDLSNYESWNNVKNIWYQMAYKRAPYANFLLLGNKKDLERAVSLDEIYSWCKDKGIYFIQTCAVTGQSIDQVFFTLAALIDSHQDYITKASFSLNTSQSFVEQTTKSGTRQGSIRSSVMAVYNHQKTQSFFLKKQKQKLKEEKKCCS